MADATRVDGGNWAPADHFLRRVVKLGNLLEVLRPRAIGGDRRAVREARA